MIYLIILILIIILSIILKIRSNYLFLLAGLLIILHPYLITKQHILAVYQLSIIVFLLFLSALIIKAIKNILPFKIDNPNSLIVNLIEKNIKITIVRIKKDVLEKKYSSILLIILFVFLYWKINLTAAALGILFFAFILYKWDSRIIAVLALACLGACPFLLIFKKESSAENFAIYAYYFLVITIILQIVEYKRANKLSSQGLEHLKDKKKNNPAENRINNRIPHCL